jgi:hypothetical protein
VVRPPAPPGQPGADWHGAAGAASGRARHSALLIPAYLARTRPEDGNAQGTFTVPNVYDLSYLGHTLRQDDKRRSAARCSFPGARQTAGYLLRTVRCGGSPHALAGMPIAESARPCRALTMRFESAQIAPLCTQFIVARLWPIVAMEGSYRYGQPYAGGFMSAIASAGCRDDLKRANRGAGSVGPRVVRIRPRYRATKAGPPGHVIRVGPPRGAAAAQH